MRQGSILRATTHRFTSNASFHDENELALMFNPISGAKNIGMICEGISQGVPAANIAKGGASVPILFISSA
jgi:hypothetical protein